MCPYCAVRGRPENDGRPRGQACAAAKISNCDQRRVSLVIHRCPPQGGGAPETFGELNRRHSAESFRERSTQSAILSAQYDGLDMEDQLTCGTWSFHDTVMKFRQGAANHLAVANALKCSRRSSVYSQRFCRNNVLRR